MNSMKRQFETVTTRVSVLLLIGLGLIITYGATPDQAYGQCANGICQMPTALVTRRVPSPPASVVEYLPTTRGLTTYSTAEPVFTVHDSTPPNFEVFERRRRTTTATAYVAVQAPRYRPIAGGAIPAGVPIVGYAINPVVYRPMDRVWSTSYPAAGPIRSIFRCGR